MSSTSDKRIDTLVPDIEKVLSEGVDVTPFLSESLEELGKTLHEKLLPVAEKDTGDLRMSNFGTGCIRQLWYRVNRPKDAEELDPHTRLKFLYGHVIEWLLLFLAKAAGHKVEGEQTTLYVEGVPGHRDAIIDGHLVDVKSASKYGYQKFKNNTVPKDDTFGYMDQLSLYHHASLDDLEDKKTASFLALEKEGGYFTLDTYPMPDRDWETEIRKKKELVHAPEPPSRGYEPVPYGRSGNESLPVVCSYCPFKATCHPGLRTFIYSGKPVYLTRVEREPEVQEIK